ncbi:sulfate transport system ATP-binding protein [Orbus hercynius]|uniref:Sulfate transport system ATP-binding protein n=1 Tax=Orbus hercynius TaxID=593135 RepID=A0A495RKJ7_9GAMM|nr:TOBE-like domain-containing protein [Orbus hercynius]RKS87820.1 sulfate transport system ATP-binding protein [Orbus hercynius]
MGIMVQNLSKDFGDFNALKNINFTIEQGEFAALLGPSGCGKTTLLRMIAGLEATMAGEIYFDQQNVTHQSAQLRDIGFVFQNYALFRHMTVAKNIAFGLRIKASVFKRDSLTINRRVKELLELVQLETLADRYPDQLSGGQRQRVALARALATKPKVLLLDEPFSALDAKVRKDLRRWLRNFHHDINVTSIFVTHDQEEALEVADKIILMNQGKIEQIGTPEQVYKKPQTAFVAHFLGDVNLLHGYIERNQLHIGDFKQDMSTQGSWADQVTIAYVRPHEIAVFKSLSLRHDSNGSSGQLVAKIMRLHTAGPTVFLELSLAHQPKPIDVSIPFSQYQQNHFMVGDIVYLQPLLLNIFVQDELIEFMI